VKSYGEKRDPEKRAPEKEHLGKQHRKTPQQKTDADQISLLFLQSLKGKLKQHGR
tara:strand:- start:354 stop:518 length:165 start_codon:yes stop_codon:yes gene_type:complete